MQDVYSNVNLPAILQVVLAKAAVFENVAGIVVVVLITIVIVAAAVVVLLTFQPSYRLF